MVRVVFIGFRFVGKSKISREVARYLECQHVSMDKIIVESIGTSISDFVGTHGWEQFRTEEMKVAKSLESKNNIVIDAGGGVVEYENTMRSLLFNSSIIIWLDASIDVILYRLKSKTSSDRPLLTETSFEDDVRINYERRRPLYQKYADLRFISDSAPMKALVWDIAKRIRFIERTRIR